MTEVAEAKEVKEVTEKMAETSLEAVYTSEARGSDEAGEGTYKVPYKTILQAMRRAGKEPFPTIYQDSKPDSDAAKAGQKYEVVAKSQLKKMTKLWQQEVRKAEQRAKKEAEDAETQAKCAEEAKKITEVEVHPEPTPTAPPPPTTTTPHLQTLRAPRPTNLFAAYIAGATAMSPPPPYHTQPIQYPTLPSKMSQLD